MLNFCTYFNQYYLSRGLALYHSLARHVRDLTLWVLCLDETTAVVLDKLNYPGIKTVPLADLESSDKDLLAVKPSRTLIEYFFTLSPVLPLYLLETHPELDSITYLDSDLFFFDDPAPIYAELGKNSIYIIPHRFPERISDRAQYGVYNVGLLIFRNDECSRICLRWWREKCLEWCYDRLEGDRFADQKYLDHWPDMFDGVHVSQNVGANLAPWNFANYQIMTGPNGKATVDRQPLIFYHFQAFRMRSWWLYETNTEWYGPPMNPSLVHWLYDPYMQTLKQRYREIKRTGIPTSDPFHHARYGVPAGPSLRTLLQELRAGKTFLHLGL